MMNNAECLCLFAFFSVLFMVATPFLYCFLLIFYLYILPSNIYFLCVCFFDDKGSTKLMMPVFSFFLFPFLTVRPSFLSFFFAFAH